MGNVLKPVVQREKKRTAERLRSFRLSYISRFVLGEISLAQLVWGCRSVINSNPLRYVRMYVPVIYSSSAFTPLEHFCCFFKYAHLVLGAEFRQYLEPTIIFAPLEDNFLTNYIVLLSHKSSRL